MRTFLYACLGVLSLFTGLRAQSSDFNFESDFQGWVCDFADYNIADSTLWHLRYSRDTMPDVRPQQYGIWFKGDNFSDDLFFFTKRKMTGLIPNASYSINYSIDVLTNLGADAIGGSDLTLKAGATAVEPIKVPNQGLYRMNIDKGNQTRPGPDMDTLGHVNHPFPTDRTYHLVTFSNAKHLFRVNADAQGAIWLIVGAESAFETPAEFLVAEVRVTLALAAGIARARVRAGPRIEGAEAISVLGRKLARTEPFRNPPGILLISRRHDRSPQSQQNLPRP